MDTKDKQVSEEASLGMKLVQKTKELMKRELNKHGELDEDWDLDIDKDIVEEEVITSDEFFERFKAIFDNLWDEVADEVLYEKRQAESDRREIERTDRRAYQAEKARQIKSMKQRS